jgi:outer membrane protein OmpA-like peptidoglycan-associated protein
MAGIAYAVTQSIRITLGYRYFSVPDLKFTTAAGASVDSDYASHDVLLGIRFLFGAPSKPMPAPRPVQAPPPEPAPAPAPAPAPQAAPAPAPAPPVSRNFLVFFDWNSATLTPQAQGIVNSAASEAKRVGQVRIRATGHADRSGPTNYNQRLSMRRAIAVRGALEAQGIPRNEIAIFAKGEADPLVPTADGVREPQNRRVEIILE